MSALPVNHSPAPAAKGRRVLPIQFDPTAPLDLALSCTVLQLDRLEKVLTDLETSLHRLGHSPVDSRKAPVSSAGEWS